MASVATETKSGRSSGEVKTVSRYALKVVFTERLLASSPCDPEVYKRFISEKKRQAQVNQGEEVETLDASKQEEIGWSVFHKDETGLFLFNYKLRGFLKEAAAAVTGKEGMTAFKSKVDKWVFISPRRLYLVNGDALVIKEPAGYDERPIRAMTMQGPRTSLKRSDFVGPGTSVEAVISVLPLGQREITEQRLREWLDYGGILGLGERRTDGYGTFEYELRPL